MVKTFTPKADSNNSFAKKSRDYNHMLGLKFKIIPARKFKKICEKAYWESLHDICPE